MRKEIFELQLALEGKIGEHHRSLLSVQLRRLWAAEKIYIVEQHIQETLKSYAAEILPGVDTALAGAIIAELGRDMSVFENVSDPAFWMRVCPGSNNRRVFVDWHAPCLRSLAEFAPENGTVTCDSCARRELTDNDGVTVGSSMVWNFSALT